MKMNPVVHFEMPAKDKNRVSNFYTTAFGWNMQQMGLLEENYQNVVSDKSKLN